MAYRGGVGSHNAKHILRKMVQRKKRVVSELNAAARELRPILNAECKKVLTEKIYNVEIPFRATVSDKTRKKFAGTSTQRAGGKDLRQWKRAGNGGGILGAEKARVEGTTIILLNSKEYARFRYTLGTPQGRKIKSKGVQSVQWHHEAIKRKWAVIRAVRRKHVLQALIAR